MSYVLVFAGAGLGGALRYAVGQAALWLFGPGFPFGTLIVNVAGCLAIGVLARPLLVGEHDAMRLLLVTGVLGGFTTFSAFALDAASLVEADAIASAFVYVALSVVLSLAAVAAGLMIGRGIAG